MAAGAASQLGLRAAGLGRGWPGGQADVAVLQQKHLPQKRKMTPFFSGSCSSSL
uniref:SURF1 cytochrome c oxidase assembly factor n=1 Tax=Pan troglodytes TaxID=9598 RepID=A0A2I3SGK2_PANTR